MTCLAHLGMGGEIRIITHIVRFKLTVFITEKCIILIFTIVLFYFILFHSETKQISCFFLDQNAALHCIIEYVDNTV